MERSGIRLWAVVCVVSLSAVGGLAVQAAPASATTGPTIHVVQTTADLADALTVKPDLTLGSVTSGTVNLKWDGSQQFQSIDGFGAAFTDTSTYLMNQKLTATARAALMSDLFTTNGSKGIGLSFMRDPIGASDYSATPASSPGAWSFDDNGGTADPTLANFSISHDLTNTIPIIKQAQQLNPQMKLFANTWSPPAWMKTNNSMIGNANGSAGTLSTTSYDAFATYLVKFVRAYAANGVHVWALTPQNEPQVYSTNYPGMNFPASNEATFVGSNLAPALQSAGLSTKIIGCDGCNSGTAYWQTLLSNGTARATMDGIGFHCYQNDLADMSTVHTNYAGQNLYETECSTGTLVPGQYEAPMNASQVALESTNNWAKGVDLWNIATDPSGGPRMATDCVQCNGLVTIDQTTGAVTYNDNFYQLGQFSKFVRPGAVRVSYTDGGGVWAQAYQNLDGSQELVAYNTNSSATTFTLTWKSLGSVSYTLPAHATVTFSRDAQQVTLKANTANRYVTALNSGPSAMVASATTVSNSAKFTPVTNSDGSTSLLSSMVNRYVTTSDPNWTGKLFPGAASIGANEKFTLVTNADGTVSLKASNGMYVTSGTTALTPTSSSIGTSEEFSEIYNDDGTISLLAPGNSKYVTVPDAGSQALIANRATAGAWEQYDRIENADGTISFRALVNGQYVSLAADGHFYASASTIGPNERLTVTNNSDGSSSLNVGNAQYVSSDSTGSAALVTSTTIGTGEKFTIQ